MIEPKGVDTSRMKDRCNYVFLSNYWTSIYLEEDDCRYSISNM